MKRRLLEWLSGVIVLGGLLVTYRWHGGASLWFMIFLISIIMACGLLIQLFGPRQIIVRRSLRPAMIHSGEEAVVVMEVSFRSPLPIPWLAVDDYYTDGSFRRVLFPMFRRSFTYRYKLPNLTRGHYIFDACVLEWGGLLGWFRGSRVVKGEEELIVLPEPLYIGSNARQSAVFPGEPDCRNWSNLVSAGAKGADIREYMPGDPLNRIHWKSSARRGRLHTFLPEETLESAVGVILDRSLRGYPADSADGDLFDSESLQSFETAVSAAAGLLLASKDSGERAALICGEEQATGHLPMAATGPFILQDEEGSTTEMLTKLSKLSLSEGPSLLLQLEEAGRWVRPGMRIAVVTGMLNEELGAAASRITALGAHLDIYCTGPVPEIQEDGSSRSSHSRQPGLFEAAALLSRTGAGVFVIHDNRILRMGHAESALSGEGAV